MNNDLGKAFLNKKFLFKICITFVIIIIFRAVTNFVSPIIANSLAMEQMYNYDSSSLWIQLYAYLSQYTWMLAIIFIIAMFKSEIALLFKLLRSKRKNEEN